MKNYKRHFILIVFLIPLIGFSQNNITLSQCIIKKQSISRDSAGKLVFRQDSIDVNVFLSFSNLTSNVSQIYLGLGPSTNSYSQLNDTIAITSANNRYYISWNHSVRNLIYSKNIFLKYRLPINANLVWGTVNFKDNQNQVSQKKFQQVQ
jgi:hypothetical protein